MNIDMIIRIACIGMLLAALNLVLTKAGRDDIAQMATLAGLAIVVFIVLSEIWDLFQSIRGIFGL